MVLVWAEHQDGKFKKNAFEAVSYGRQAADSFGCKCIAVVVGDKTEVGELGHYGADGVICIEDCKCFDSQQYTQALADIASANEIRLIVLSHSSNGKNLAGRLGVRLDAGVVTGVSSLPELDANGLIFRKPVFSGKAIAKCMVNTPTAVITLMSNAIQPAENERSAERSEHIGEVGEVVTKVVEVKKVEGSVPLPEADIVVSAGRGMKEASNWGIIEELAEVLGAATACSRPVADVGWRPHHEHVGQTGLAVRPNLYIAIGISGAIQHLAGVNNSKTIVVINKDPEAPFFKAADYGICADLFDVVPRLTEAVRKFKS